MGEDELHDFLDNLEGDPLLADPDAAPAAAIPAGKSVLPPADPEKVKLYENYPDQLIKAAALEAGAVLSIGEALKILAKPELLSGSGEDARKVMRSVNKAFWSLYQGLSLELLSKGDNPGKARLFLNAGLLDEKGVSPEFLTFLGQMKEPAPGAIPVVTLFQWLTLIHMGEENPSINELGVDYAKFLREKERSMSSREKEEFEKRPEPVKNRDRVLYELTNMVPTVSRMLSTTLGGTLAPLLQSNAGALPGSLMTAERVRALVEEIRGYDFSIFYRDSLYRLSATANDIMKTEVEPYFILFPMCGDKIVFWQEFSGTKKTSRGRFMVPMFFTGDPRPSMIRALAAYRWELNRSIKGTLWADPVEGGLTGAFYDYVTFFKKNTKLAVEAKEKLAAVITANRKDVKRVFTAFYTTWIEFERKGILRLDRASREILYKYVPFSKDIRAGLAKMPAYSELNDKYNVVSNREIGRIEMRYKKTRDGDGQLAPEVQATLDFYRK